MHRTVARFLAALGPISLAGAAACVVAAAGAGAGGGIYFTERGVESVVPASVERAAGATARAFADLKVRQTKSETAQGEDGERRQIDGSSVDRDVSVSLKQDGKSTRVQVVVKKSAVTWDKDFARAILDKIVAYSR